MKVLQNIVDESNDESRQNFSVVKGEHSLGCLSDYFLFTKFSLRKGLEKSLEMVYDRTTQINMI